MAIMGFSLAWLGVELLVAAISKLAGWNGWISILCHGNILQVLLLDSSTTASVQKVMKSWILPRNSGTHTQSGNSPVICIDSNPATHSGSVLALKYLSRRAFVLDGFDF